MHRLLLTFKSDRYRLKALIATWGFRLLLTALWLWRGPGGA